VVRVNLITQHIFGSNTFKWIIKKVYEVLDKALVTGRHTGTSAAYDTHTACNGSKTKLILTESNSVIFFMNAMGGKTSKYLLDSYLCVDMRQIDRLKTLNHVGQL
jgi:hypothetical protein